MEERYQVVAFDITVHIRFSEPEVAHGAQTNPKHIVGNSQFSLEAFLGALRASDWERVDVRVGQYSQLPLCDVFHQPGQVNGQRGIR